MRSLLSDCIPWPKVTASVYLWFTLSYGFSFCVSCLFLVFLVYAFARFMPNASSTLSLVDFLTPPTALKSLCETLQNP